MDMRVSSRSFTTNAKSPKTTWYEQKLRQSSSCALPHVLELRGPVLASSPPHTHPSVVQGRVFSSGNKVLFRGGSLFQPLHSVFDAPLHDERVRAAGVEPNSHFVFCQRDVSYSHATQKKNDETFRLRTTLPGGLGWDLRCSSEPMAAARKGTIRNSRQGSGAS